MHCNTSAAPLNVPAGQLSHTRSLLAVGACVCSWPGPHVRHAAHTVSRLAPHASLAQRPPLHVWHAAHTLPCRSSPAFCQWPAGHVPAHVLDGVRYRSPSHDTHALGPAPLQLAHDASHRTHRPVSASAYCPTGQLDTHRPPDSDSPDTHDRQLSAAPSPQRRHVAWHAAHSGLPLPSSPAPHSPRSHSPVDAQSPSVRQARHTRSLLLVAATATNDASSHAVTDLQLACPAASWYVPAAHAVHCASAASVALRDSYVPAAHTVTARHAVSVCATCGWNVLPSSQLTHTRSDDAVGPADCRCPAPHRPTLLHRSCPGSSWYAVRPSHATHSASVFSVPAVAVYVPAAHRRCAVQLPCACDVAD